MQCGQLLLLFLQRLQFGLIFTLFLLQEHLPRFLAASGSILLLIGLTAGFLLLVVPVAAAQVDMIRTAAPALYGDAREWLIESPLRLLRQVGERLAPTLGQHNGEVLKELLGLNDREIAALERDGIIGTVATQAKPVKAKPAKAVE